MQARPAYIIGIMARSYATTREVVSTIHAVSYRVHRRTSKNLLLVVCASLNHTKSQARFIVIFVRDLKEISGSSRQFDSVIPSLEPMETRWLIGCRQRGCITV